ncbi:MAG: hypothetical protein EAZ99_10860 [Alphaproteobacteria bacterium]|nr:hypothetical protein [Alphaproteobacteria bacterium]TAD89250.1 MAG: hypothetical protein EAZ99_10860 [Alphaproteobacteria bacterium]
MADEATRMLIARAIKKADTRYFWEDYSKQADAVVQALAEQGLRIVPASPTAEMTRSAKEALQYGIQHKQDLVATIWRVMVAAALR